MSDKDSSRPPEGKRARRGQAVLDRAAQVLNRRRLLEARATLREHLPALRPSAIQDHLLIAAQQATYRELHQRFTERAGRGEKGLDNALDALDAMWLDVRQLRAGAPSIMKTLASPHESVQERLARFYTESTGLLEDAIRAVFAEDLGQLAIPPERMAVLVRVLLEGLIVELAQARDEDDVVIADQAYADLRGLFERFVLLGAAAPAIDPITLEPIPLPW